MKYKYKILSRYPNDPNRKEGEFGEWQVGVFNCLEDANDYIAKVVARYSKFEWKYHLEMKAVRVTEQEGRDHNAMLQNLID